jgi:predicted RNA binding protein YcfA (HicA-like mRNA interferase family)
VRAARVVSHFSGSSQGLYSRLVALYSGARLKVRDVIRVIERDGWILMRTRGSHRQFRHPFKSGTVTISGNLARDMPLGTVKSVIKQARLSNRVEDANP